MTVLCGCYVDALWAINELANAWVWLRNRGWRKLDDSSTRICTRLLALAALAKSRNVPISLHEEQRGDAIVITEIYDFSAGGAMGPTQEISFAVSECVYGWTAAYAQRGTHHRAHPPRAGRGRQFGDDGDATRHVETRH